ncbi:MAG TPA: GNAT family N-acetyltransferase, partial [Bacteroidia bacterium]|nr:GNAT family N-acetyltransferase [Bacteroidia bacterium]
CMNDERILVLNNHQIDKTRWDETIDKSYNGLIYAYSWYLDLVSPGWHGLVSEGYKAVMPLTWRKKFGFEYLFPPFFTQQLGVFSRQHLNSEHIKVFIEKIPARYKFIDINLNSENMFLPQGFKFTKNINCTLSLNKNYEEIHNGYSQNLTRNLKKANGQHQLQVVGMKEANALIKLFRENKGKKIKNLKDKEYEILSNLINEAIERKMCEVYYAYHENRLVAGAVFLKTRHRITFLFSAVNTEGKHFLAMPVIVDRYISMHQKRDLIFDFEGSNNPELARFYKSFGATENIYLKIKKNNLPLPFRLLKK